MPSEVSPMYMPGRLRTASSPSRIWIEPSPYAADASEPVEIGTPSALGNGCS